jgi:hypothetical protein
MQCSSKFSLSLFRLYRINETQTIADCTSKSRSIELLAEERENYSSSQRLKSIFVILVAAAADTQMFSVPVHYIVASAR